MSHELIRAIRELPTKEIVVVLDHYSHLLTQFVPSAGLSEPHLLFLDNNILQDLKKQSVDNKRKLRAYGVRLFADFMVNHSALQVELALPPAILHEFAQRSIPESESQWNVITREAHEALGTLGMVIRSFGAASYAEAKNVLGQIVHDESVIGCAIGEIKSGDWTMALRQGSILWIPFALSQRLAPDTLDLRYFDLGCVRWVLSALIERLILTNKANDARVRKTFHNEDAGILAALNKLRKGVLQGLGDIELLSLCAIGSQFHQEEEETRTALTFDTKLQQALVMRSGLFATHEPFAPGQDSATDIQRKFDELMEGRRRLKVVAERDAVFRQRAAIHFGYLSSRLV